jgi:hypothetical protein
MLLVTLAFKTLKLSRDNLSQDSQWSVRFADGMYNKSGKLCCNNRTAHIRHQKRKTTVLSCHRCLINTDVAKLNNI